MKAMKKNSGTLKLDLAQYRELAAFSQFASDLDEATRNQLDRGARMMELLKQGLNSPVPAPKQVCALYKLLNTCQTQKRYNEKLEVLRILPRLQKLWSLFQR